MLEYEGEDVASARADIIQWKAKMVTLRKEHDPWEAEYSREYVAWYDNKMADLCLKVSVAKNFIRAETDAVKEAEAAAARAAAAAQPKPTAAAHAAEISKLAAAHAAEISKLVAAHAAP